MSGDPEVVVIDNVAGTVTLQPANQISDAYSVRCVKTNAEDVVK
jgi:hypothetical protein